MSHSFELEKIYNPHEIEERLSRFWIEKGISQAPENPKRDSKYAGKKPFSIVIPPPNVTGSLHIGHALNNALQDILVRYHRMQGNPTLWVFGTDHAGIATQNVVERQLKEEGLSRYDLGREKLVERIWKWKAESGGTIKRQLQKLGASLDWSRERFTMDEGLSQAVREVFVRLYEEGLMYRDQRLIHWCPRCQTSLSDLEVEYQEIKGHLWHIRYFFEESPNEFVTVATTRPETLLGDTAVAVHPDDERYQGQIGKTLIVPFVNRLIPLLADSYVDSSFGTGAVKITPAHDFNDFEMGKRHNLERINVLEPNGRMNENAGPFVGIDRAECRKKIVAALEEAGQLEKIEDYKTNIGHCYRCRTVVEPYLSLQWFVRTESLAKPAIEAVRKGDTNFHPKHWEKTYFSWMENIKDWCVSRQIWWGHRIPAWYCGEGHITVARENPTHCATCRSPEIVQDEDVLDTWFSSALWPFSTLGWPNEAQFEKLKDYYPTSVLVTSFDIIFFWVARMMMMGLHFRKEVPFKDVYIHALVRDAQGQKMSKSKGNVVNPLEVMEEYGTDALRFTLTALAAQGRDIKLDPKRVEGYRNFCNKIWNAARFLFSTCLPIAGSFEEIRSVEPRSDSATPTQGDLLNEEAWILVCLKGAVAKVRRAIENYEFNEAAHALYTFIWHEFCDWYLELIKPRLYAEGTEKKQTARFALKIFEQTLRLLHPFMPFLTEELWQRIHGAKESSIAVEPFPKKISDSDFKRYTYSWKVFDYLIRTVSVARNIRGETGIPLKQEISHAYLWAPETSDIAIYFPSLQTKILEIEKIVEIRLEKPSEPVVMGLIEGTDAKLYIPACFVDLEKERARQNKALVQVEKDISLLSAKLANSNFVASAPEELVSQTREEVEKRKKQKFEIEEALRHLSV